MSRNSSTDELSIVSEQIFNKIVFAEKNIGTLKNYCEEDKDYNIEHKTKKNQLIDPITVNYINYFSNYIKCINFEYKNIVFNIKIYTKNYENNSNYITLIKLGIIVV